MDRCDERGVAAFHVLRRRQNEPEAFLYAFDLLELDGTDPAPLADAQGDACQHPAEKAPRRAAE
jgi:hypothetical protein